MFRERVRWTGDVRSAGALLLAGSALWPAAAAAHELVPGVTGFAAALLHPVFLFDQLVVLVVAGLLAGQAGRERVALCVAALIAGLVCGYAVPVYDILPAIVAAMLTLFAAGIGGAIVAAAPPLPPAAALGVSVLLGAAIGSGTFAEVPTLRGSVEALGGAAITSAILVASIGYGVAWLKWPWTRIGVRIGGSWIAAASVMVVAYIVSRWSQWG